MFAFQPVLIVITEVVAPVPAVKVAMILPLSSAVFATEDEPSPNASSLEKLSPECPPVTDAM